MRFDSPVIGEEKDEDPFGEGSDEEKTGGGAILPLRYGNAKSRSLHSPPTTPNAGNSPLSSPPSSPPRSPYRYQQSDDDEYMKEERTPQGRRRRYFRSSLNSDSSPIHGQTSSFPAVNMGEDKQQDDKEILVSNHNASLSLNNSIDSRRGAQTQRTGETLWLTNKVLHFS